MHKFWIICSLLIIAPFLAEGFLPLLRGVMLLKKVLAPIRFVTSKLANSNTFNVIAKFGAIISALNIFDSSHQRNGRSVATIDEWLVHASVNDNDDCAKKLVCMINATPEESVTAEEKIVADMFSFQDEINLSKSTVEFDLAALVGRMGGPSKCMSIYARCLHDKKDLIEALRA